MKSSLSWFYLLLRPEKLRNFGNAGLLLLAAAVRASNLARLPEMRIVCSCSAPSTIWESMWAALQMCLACPCSSRPWNLSDRSFNLSASAAIEVDCFSHDSTVVSQVLESSLPAAKAAIASSSPLSPGSKSTIPAASCFISSQRASVVSMFIICLNRSHQQVKVRKLKLIRG